MARSGAGRLAGLALWVCLARGSTGERASELRRMGGPFTAAGETRGTQAGWAGHGTPELSEGSQAGLILCHQGPLSSETVQEREKPASKTSRYCVYAQRCLES